MIVGSRLRTPIGVLEVTAVDKVTRPTRRGRAGGRLRERAGRARLVPEADGRLLPHRAAPGGPDPRLALRELPPDDAVFAALERMGEWTYEYLQAIADHPGKRAPDLAESFGRETAPFKRDVRKLKELGLTISLEVGYELSPRGQLTLSSRPNALRKTSP